MAGDCQIQLFTLDPQPPDVVWTASEAPPVPCVKELVQSITALGSEDASLEICFKSLKQFDFYFRESGTEIRIEF